MGGRGRSRCCETPEGAASVLADVMVTMVTACCCRRGRRTARRSGAGWPWARTRSITGASGPSRSPRCRLAYRAAWTFRSASSTTQLPPVRTVTSHPRQRPLPSPSWPAPARATTTSAPSHLLQGQRSKVQHPGVQTRGYVKGKKI